MGVKKLTKASLALQVRHTSILDIECLGDVLMVQNCRFQQVMPRVPLVYLLHGYLQEN